MSERRVVQTSRTRQRGGKKSRRTSTRQYVDAELVRKARAEQREHFAAAKRELDEHARQTVIASLPQPARWAAAGGHMRTLKALNRLGLPKKPDIKRSEPTFASVDGEPGTARLSQSVCVYWPRGKWFWRRQDVKS